MAPGTVENVHLLDIRTMILRYENSLDDMIAFNRYHCAHSPTVKKTIYTSMFWVLVLVLIGSLFISPTEEFSRPIITAGAIVFAGLLIVVLRYNYSVTMDRQVRRLYSEGMNKGTICQHELQVDESGLVERTEFNEIRHSWQGIERIAETDEYAFIYISAVAAHVIPKYSVSAGDSDEFLTRAKDLWLAACPNAETG